MTNEELKKKIVELSQFRRHSIKNYESEIFLWYEDNSDELVGQVILDNIDDQLWIKGVYISPKYRKKGLSYDLLGVAIALGGRRLAVRKHNVVAFEIYKKLGFKIFDENKEFYFMKLQEDL